MKKVFIILLLALSLLPLCACDKKEENTVYTMNVEFFPSENFANESGDVEKVADTESVTNKESSAKIVVNQVIDYYCNISSGTDELKFNLFANAFRDDAVITPLSDKNDASCGLEIINVSSNNQALDYEICGADKNILWVKLDELLVKGDRYKLTVDYCAFLPKGDYRFCEGENSVNLGNWYPQLCVYENGTFYECEYSSRGDPFYSEVADYSVSITVPSEYVVASSSKATSCDVEENKTNYSYKLNNSRDFALVLSKKFKMLVEKQDDVEISYYYFTDENAENTFCAIKDSLKWFSEKFGDYPYESYSVCQSDFNAGGMEYPALTYVNCTLSEKDTVYTVVHETAHQWWYAVVGNNQLEESYLDESLAEYSTTAFFAANEKYDISASMIVARAKKSCYSYVDVLTALGKTPDNIICKKLSDYNSEYEYIVMNYSRGLVMMSSVEEVLGVNKTLSLLSNYYNKYKFKIATSENFISCMKPADKIIQSYLDGKAQIYPN